jgi:hypothetical protein
LERKNLKGQVPKKLEVQRLSFAMVYACFKYTKGPKTIAGLKKRVVHK